MSRVYRAIWGTKEEGVLVDLWNEKKLSAAEIGVRMGGLSRCAVLGKIGRLRESGKYELISRSPAKRPDGQPNRPPSSYIRLKSKRTPPVLIIVPKEEQSQPTSETNVDITALERYHCREIVADYPKTLYCGAQRKDGSSFCAHHHSKNFVKLEPRMRSRTG